jgi:hypothetical protein
MKGYSYYHVWDPLVSSLPNLNLKNSKQNLYFLISSGDFLGTNIMGTIHGDSQGVTIPLTSISSSWYLISS